MSITIHTQPQELSPAYNQMIIALTSSNQTQANFQFIADIYTNGEYSSRMKVPINPDGYCVFDIHRHIENKISYNFTPTANGWYPATQSFCTYSVNFSEEFRYTFRFYDNNFIGGLVGFAADWTGTTPQPLFQVGDSIIVSQDAGYTNYSYEGLTTVTSITYSIPQSRWVVVTSKPFGSSTPAEPGNIVLANFELTTIASTYSIGEQYAFNGVYSFGDFINYDETDYQPNTSAPYAQWLTNVPDNYEVGLSSSMWLQAYKTATNQQKDLMIQTNRGIYRITSAFSGAVGSNPFERLCQVGVGPHQLLTYTSSIITGTSSLPVMDSTTATYSVWTRNQVLQQDTEVKVFKIKDLCSRYEKIQLIFMDKLGSFIPYTFNKVNRNNKNISRTDYQQVYGQYAPASQNWGYNTWDRGKKNLDTVVTETFTVNSDWVNQSTSDFLMELFESPQVYWINESGVTQAINITDTTTERKQTVNDQIINYTLTFMLANKSQSQRG